MNTSDTSLLESAQKLSNAASLYDHVDRMIDGGRPEVAVLLLLGQLSVMHRDQAGWPAYRAALQAHPTYPKLMSDPFSARCALRPRGYAGDAELIDIIYSKRVPAGATRMGRDIFGVTVEFQTAEGVRQRRAFAERELIKAHAAGARILSLACGHFREGASLSGQDLSNITVVDQDPLSLAVVRSEHGPHLNIVEANIIRFLKAAIRRGERWDYIYTLGLTDYFDEREMALFCRLLGPVRAPGGTIVIANFVPDHLAVAWMDAVMDWHLIYRNEADLERHARTIGLAPRTWRDPTGTIAFCEMNEERSA